MRQMTGIYSDQDADRKYHGLVDKVFAGRPGFNLRLSHTKDSKNGTWCLLA